MAGRGTCCLDFTSAWRGLFFLSSVLSLFSSVSLTEEPPKFVEHPQSLTVKHHDNVTLSCRAEPKSADLRWKHNQEWISSDAENGIEVNQGILHISLLKHRRKHQMRIGVYQCVANNSIGTVVSQEATVQRAVISHYEEAEDIYVNATEGNVALIPCNPPKGDPTAMTVFEVNSTTIDRSTGRLYLLPSGNLQIGNVKQSDQGIYHCISINPVSGHKRIAPNRVHLRVVAPWANSPVQVIKAPRRTTEVIRGHNLTLECVIEGAPVPLITWDKYGGQLPEGRYIQVLGNLVITNVQVLDQGTYICRAENGVSQPQAVIAMVDVLEPPVIRIPPSDRSVKEGSSVSFQCLTRGHPRVKTEWLHNARSLSSDSYITITDTTLTINSVGKHYGGMYQCIARSKLGMTYATARLRVRVHGQNTTDDIPDTPHEMQDIAPDSVPAVPSPIIALAPSNMSVEEGTTIALSCDTEPTRDTDINWLKDGKPLEHSPLDTGEDQKGDHLGSTPLRHKVAPGGALQIFNVQSGDEGEYTCVASNGGGSIAASAFLTVAARPIITHLSADDAKTKFSASTLSPQIFTTFPDQGSSLGNASLPGAPIRIPTGSSEEGGGQDREKERKKKKVPTATLR